VNWFPIFLGLRGVDCLVVGGGPVALRKARQLVAACAKVTVVAPFAAEGLAELARTKGVTVIESNFVPEFARGCRLVFAASNDPKVNHAVAAAGAKYGALVNVVDDSDHSDFIAPALVEREGLTIAIGSDGLAPIISREIASWMEALLPRGIERLATLIGRWRAAASAAIASPDLRRRFWQRVIRGQIGRWAMIGRHEEADRLMALEIEHSRGEFRLPGEVHIIGAGPGDPELLTLRAIKLMNDCDVVLFDRLVPTSVLSLARRGAERIDVGKPSEGGAATQERINRMMIDLAREGKIVVRLKGGDPFIFGRGGEEAEALAAAGVPFEIVPGITAALGCAASSAIPLTHRRLAHSVIFIAAHSESPTWHPDWPRLAARDQTLVFYMARGAATTICSKLVEHGLDPATPAALIARGCLPDEQVLTGTVATLPGIIEASMPTSPALLIVGDVVAARTRADDTRESHAADSITGVAPMAQSYFRSIDNRPAA
jgi:uroporphyrin-III C-methyltransferase/precorrin-2 dehydrogenase/sirohydrochlorin ferrochelatase